MPTHDTAPYSTCYTCDSGLTSSTIFRKGFMVIDNPQLGSYPKDVQDAAIALSLMSGTSTISASKEPSSPSHKQPPLSDHTHTALNTDALSDIAVDRAEASRISSVPVQDKCSSFPSSHQRGRRRGAKAHKKDSRRDALRQQWKERALKILAQPRTQATSAQTSVMNWVYTELTPYPDDAWASCIAVLIDRRVHDMAVTHSTLLTFGNIHSSVNQVRNWFSNKRQCDARDRMKAGGVGGVPEGLEPISVDGRMVRLWCHAQTKIGSNEQWTDPILLISAPVGLLLRAVVDHLPSLSLPRWLGGDGGLPPVYYNYHRYELQLPQHNADYLPIREMKFIWMANHVRGAGWGNALQELLLNSYLAYRSRRSFVFDNYTWDEFNTPYSLSNGELIPSQIPLSTFIRGPTVGAPFIADPSHPVAIMKKYWDQICPQPKIIHNEDILASLDREATAGLLIDRWVEVLGETEDRCVEVPVDSHAIFDIFIFGDGNRLLDAWPSFSASPIISEFGWSPLIELAFDENRDLFWPSATEPYLSSTPFITNAARYSVVPGLLVLHIRRGDFEEHCVNLALWQSTYTGFNSFPELPDKLERIPPGASNTSTVETYRRHCFPDIGEIVRKVEDVRASDVGQGLQNIFVMTNGASEWIHELKAALESLGGWERISSSKDLVLSKEQKYVSQAVDMLIGQRAQVVIGNGFSSLTGQIIMLRMANGLPPESHYFW
ncbi:uncharacterized protein FIBRA_04863 [Fibroporia radiculosa]|uniref:Homeobox domain-containing protein n=1 Tax=Fibroporia radiculosa TaxID=599839 RepID=J4GPY4_9APHY|nr:uncharacterized protein FIBRA_04863 [Fibroporia radiculosa]CCM02755.1 predicted protein [Fibroporia radiculosa]